MTDRDLKFCLAYLGVRDVLLVVAVASKGMMELATHDILWALGRTDFKSGVANELEQRQWFKFKLACGYYSRRPGQPFDTTRWIDEGWGGGLVPKTANWYISFVAVTRESVIFREADRGPRSVLSAAEKGDVAELRRLSCWARIDVNVKIPHSVRGRNTLQ